MLLAADGSGLRSEETRLFGLLDKIIVVGEPCRSLLTTSYGVPEAKIILLEPTLSAPSPRVSSGGAVLSTTPGDLLGLGVESSKTSELAPERETNCARTSAAASTAPRHRLRFVSVGTLSPRKDQLGLVTALSAACAAHPKELGGATLTLIGSAGADPAYAAAVRAAADAANAANANGGRFEVRLPGALPHDKTLESLIGSDAFLFNSRFESWAVAPVEAALRGVPVLSTRVGALGESLPPESTMWVGGPDGGGAGDGGGVGGDGWLASTADWEQALFFFAQTRSHLRVDAARAVPGLVRRFGQAAAGSRARAAQILLRTVGGVFSSSAVSRWAPRNGVDSAAVAATRVDIGVRRCELNADSTAPAHGCARSFGRGRRQDEGPAGAAIAAATAAAASAAEKERVRRATVMHAVACVLAAVLSACQVGSGAGGLAGLVAAQVSFLVYLCPPLSPANVVTIFRSFIPSAVVWWRAGSDFGLVRYSTCSVGHVFYP